MINVSTKSTQDSRKEDVGLVGAVSELAKFLRPRTRRSAGLEEKQTPEYTATHCYCTVVSQAKQPMAEERLAYDWIEIW